MIRDAPRVLPVGLAITDGPAVVGVLEAGPLTRYTADRLRFEAETEAADGPVRGFGSTRDKVFTLGRKSVVVHVPETLEKAGEYPVTVPAGPNPLVFAVHPDGEQVLIGTDRVRELDMKTKKERVVPTPRAASGKPLTQFVWSRDGRTSVARWNHEVITVWNPKTGEARLIEDLKAPAPATPQGLVVSDDGVLAALGTRAGELRVWNTRTGKVLLSESNIYAAEEKGRPAGSVESVWFLPTRAAHVVTVGSDGRVFIWKVDDAARTHEFKGPPGPSRSALSPDGRTLVVQVAGSMHVIELPDLRRVR
jgi:WD40 repeat protein